MFDRIREDVTCVFDRDPAARNILEVITTYPGVHAVILHRLNHWLWQIGLRWLARFMSALARFVTGVEIHPAARIGRRFFIDHGMGVVIGETSEIGDDCTLYHGVTLGGTSWQKGKRHPTLLNNVVIGAGAKVLGPITVGSGARVGSNAVVVRDVPDGATAIGIPARLVGEKDEKSRLREAVAQKIAFEAYATGGGMPDPVAASLETLLERVRALEEQVAALDPGAHEPPSRSQAQG
ncbi:MAG: serine O-acetyltransferase [Gammaproteobacteria bacterium]